jgi:hypothetical protein
MEFGRKMAILRIIVIRMNGFALIICRGSKGLSGLSFLMIWKFSNRSIMPFSLIYDMKMRN